MFFLVMCLVGIIFLERMWRERKREKGVLRGEYKDVLLLKIVCIINGLKKKILLSISVFLNLLIWL